MWLNHGDVNGLDFWNNSDAIPAAQAPKMGTIYPPEDRRREERRDPGRADRRNRVDDARQQAVDQGDDAVRVPRRRRLPHHRSHHDPHGARPEGRVQGQQGRVPRHARHARARAAGREGGSLHRRVRQGDGRPGARQHGRHGQVRQQRRQGGRRRLEHARQVDAARRHDRGRAGDAGDPRSSVERRLPHPLARARLRAVRGQSARRQAVQRAEGLRLHARAGHVASPSSTAC